MASEPHTPHARFFRSGLGLTIVTGFVLVFVVGVVFAVAYGSQRITQSATDLHKADETLRAATVVRAQVALCVFMATMDVEVGTLSTAGQDLSRGEAVIALNDLRISISELKAGGALEGTDLEEQAGEFMSIAETTMGLINVGDVAAARAVAEADLNTSFDSLVNTAVAVRGELRATVESSDTLLGHMSTVARFLVAFLVPVAVILTYRELSRRQRDELELRRRLQLERELAISRDEFIANASHELRTPLTSIAGMAMLLEESSAVKESELASELVDIVIGEASDLERMVEDLLTTARIDAGALQFLFEDVDVATEVDEVAASLSRSGMVVDIDCEPGSVRADRLRLRQVLRNLLSNANKYGGSSIQVEGRAEGRTYVIVVSDDGPGLPSEIAARVFHRFIHRGHQTATTDSVGLGLSIVHSLTVGMGGSVKYERSDGRTQFIVRISAATVPVAAFGAVGQDDVTHRSDHDSSSDVDSAYANGVAHA